MARAALNWTTQRLAETAQVGVNTVNRFERGGDARLSSVDRMRIALEAAGVTFIDGDAPGVQLNRTGAG